MNIRDRLLNLPLKTKTFHCEALDCDVTIKEFSAGERERFARESKDKPTEVATALWLVYSLVDENGERFMEVEDVENLTKVSAKAIDEIVDHIVKLNGLESQLKNSEPTQSDDSSTN